LDPYGRSSIESHLKNIHFLNIDEIKKYLLDFGFLLNSDATWTTILPHHGESIGIHNLNNIINFPAIQTYVIDHTSADPSILKWECLVKTYFTAKKDHYNIKNQTCWKVDQLIDSQADGISNQIRIKKINDVIKKTQQPLPEYYYLKRQDIIKLDYAQLFCPGGSRYLCNIIKLNATEQQHLFWDHMLKFATSPDEIECFGRIWRKSDYF
jgi:hypothetical protein